MEREGEREKQIESNGRSGNGMEREMEKWRKMVRDGDSWREMEI